MSGTFPHMNGSKVATSGLIVPDDRIRLSAVLEEPVQAVNKPPLVILLHGFGSTKNSPHQLLAAAAMHECGLATLRLDMYGHGDSDGAFREHTIFKWISNTLSAVEYIRGLGYNTVWLSGHSQGGLVAALAAGMLTDRISGLILRAPAFMIPEWARLGSRAGLPFDPDHVPDTVRIFDGRELNGNYIRVAQTIDPWKSMDRYQGPVLIIHGDEDDVVPVGDSMRAAKRYRNCRLSVIRGEGHHFDRRPEEMTSILQEWLQYIVPSVTDAN